MVKPFSLKSWRWSGGGLLVLVSVGLHGLLLAMPTPKSSTPDEAVMTLASSGESASPEGTNTETINVVRFPQPADIDPPSKPAATATPRPRSTSVVPVPSEALTTPKPSESEPLEPDSLAPDPSEPESSAALERSESNPSEPDPAPLEPESEPTPPGLVHNNKTVELSTDTRDFLTWYNNQDWNDFDLVPLPAPKELSQLPVPYEGEVCLSIPPAPGRLEVIVGSDGQLYRAPRLLATTGYDDLDTAALALAAQQNFSEAANPGLPNPTVYWLPIAVTYQGPDCP
jgi:outer membrane biosynthesis protein TonB